MYLGLTASLAVIAVAVWQGALAASERIEVTLKNPAAPNIKIEINSEYLTRRIPGFVRRHSKGGVLRTLLIDVAYPSMDPASSTKNKSKEWKSSIAISNSTPNYISRHFKLKTSKYYTEVDSEYPGLRKFVFFDPDNPNGRIDVVHAGRTFYYFKGEDGKNNDHMIKCDRMGVKNSMCLAYMQKNSTLLYRYDIPLKHLGRWKEVFSRFYEFAEKFEK